MSPATPPMPPDLSPLVAQLAQALLARGWSLATAESCTGGLIAGTCTDMAGSSAWFDRGLVTYSNQAKVDLLGVPAPLIDAHGAVSEAVARAMVQGVLQRAPVDLAVAVTGVAGPSGGSPDKPVGTVWLAWGARGAPVHAVCQHHEGGRAQVRWQTVEAALRGLLALARH